MPTRSEQSYYSSPHRSVQTFKKMADIMVSVDFARELKAFLTYWKDHVKTWVIEHERDGEDITCIHIVPVKYEDESMRNYVNHGSELLFRMDMLTGKLELIDHDPREDNLEEVSDYVDIDRYLCYELEVEGVELITAQELNVREKKGK